MKEVWKRKTRNNLKRIIFIFIGFCSVLSACTTQSAGSLEDNDLQTLLRILDKDLQQSEVYVSERLEKIADIHASTAVSDNDVYLKNWRLYDAFFPFQFDSAFHYINENLNIAEAMGDKVLKAESSVELAMLFTIAGMYLEAKEVLSTQIDTASLADERLLRYYWVQTRFNRDFQENSKNPATSAQAGVRLIWYREKLIEVLPQDSNDRMFLEVTKALDEHRYECADSVNKLLLGRVEKFSHPYAMHAYNQALIDWALRRESFRKWYTLSAISDTRSAVKDNASIASLARQLFVDEDVKRAFRYITASMDDAIYYNAKLRPWQIAQIMPLIEDKYAEKADSANRLRWLFTVFLGIASIIILVFAVAIYDTYRKLRKKAKELKKANIRLSELNIAVTEANIVKEEYIAMLLSMCSDYIDKLEGMQQDIKRRLTIGLEAELLKELSASKLMKYELENFYNTFDATFLRLYPDFVDEFNQLLREEERIILPKNGLLNTELRIFALIRLGITDSSRIAVLLRYSVQTIYNYRMRMKKRSIYEREDFEKRLKDIGSFRH